MRMEFFLHFITADIKYDFWCEENSHQFREDWVRCRINIKYLDSPDVQINCYPVNHYQEVPLVVNIDFADFRFEKATDVHNTKANIFALSWSHQQQSNVFFIAIDDKIQFRNYETYLNNLVRICRITENEHLDARTTNECSSASFDDSESLATSSTLSLFSVSAFIDDKGVAIMNKSKNIDGKKRFHGLSSVKNATKCVSKKINRILLKAKSKFRKPTAEQPVNTSLLSSSTQLTHVDLFDEEIEDENNFNIVQRCSSKISLFDDGWVFLPDLPRRSPNREHHYSPNNSFDSGSRTLVSSHSTETSLDASIYQIFAESMADLNIICTGTEKISTTKSNEPKRFIRKGTPYKLKMPHQLSLYDKDDCESSVKNKAAVAAANQSEMVSNAIDVINTTKNEGFHENEARLRSMYELKLLFGLDSAPKEPFVRRIAEKCRYIEQKLSKPSGYTNLNDSENNSRSFNVFSNILAY